VVGAPQAVSATLGQRAGAVFTCEVLDDCKEIPNLFDKDEMGGNQTVDQLLGQAITITGQNQNVKAIVRVYHPHLKSYSLPSLFLFCVGVCTAIQKAYNHPGHLSSNWTVLYPGWQFEIASAVLSFGLVINNM
jgi:hypothetical protein